MFGDHRDTARGTQVCHHVLLSYCNSHLLFRTAETRHVTGTDLIVETKASLKNLVQNDGYAELPI